MDAESLAVKYALQPIRLADVAKGTILDLATIPVPAQGHLRQVVLVQELARRALHAQVAQPVAAHDRAQAGIVLGARQLRLGLLAGGEDGSRFAVREGVERLRYSLRERIVLEVVLDHVERVGRFQDRFADLRQHCCDDY